MRERATHYQRPGPVILAALERGPMSPGRLAALIYGNHGRQALGALYVAVHRLKRRGAAVRFDEQCQRYWLAEEGAQVCPHCRGKGTVRE